MNHEMIEIEAATKAFADARAELSHIVAIVDQELALAYNQRRKEVRAALAKVVERQSKVHALVQAAPELFVKPRTVEFHGVKVGYRKGTGALEWEDDAAVVKAIRKHLPEAADILIKIEETPLKKAMSELTGAELKKIGVTVEETGDVVVVKPVDGKVEKAVKTLLKAASDELKEAA